MSFSPLLAACDECSGEINAAGDFLDTPRNLFCQSDAECQAVSTGCHTFARGMCGQAQLNVNAAMSTEWRGLSERLNECDKSCSPCPPIGLSPRCIDGFCGGRP